MQDVSRTGLRFSIPLSDIGAEDDSLLAIATRIDHLLGSSFAGDLHYEMLGPLIRKRMHLVRLGQSASTAGVELGCEFDVPLSDEETGMLGLGLPDLGVTTPDAYREVPGPQRRGAEAPVEEPALVVPKAYDAYLHPTEGHEAEPLAGETHGMRDLDAVVHVRITDRLSFPDVPSLTVALAQSLGPAPLLEILDGLLMVWTGRADLRHVEVCTPETVRLHLKGWD